MKCSKFIDYSILRDVLVHPTNMYLDCYDNVASLAFACLCEILTECREVPIEGLLYMCVPKNSNSGEDLLELKSQVIESFIRALESPIISMSRKAWRLLTILRGESQNKKLAQEIFNRYNKENKLKI
jgi:hypothetical protein